MNRYETDDILVFFECDPDRLYIDGSYLVDESKIVTALTKFYNNECTPVENTKEADIWCRGGIGYYYSLYKLN